MSKTAAVYLLLFFLMIGYGLEGISVSDRLLFSTY